MNKIKLTDWSASQLAAVHPDYQHIAVRVLDIIEQDQQLLDSYKFDLNLIEQGKPVWGFTMTGVWIAYIQEDNGSLSVIHLTMLSRFRHDYD